MYNTVHFSGILSDIVLFCLRLLNIVYNLQNWTILYRILFISYNIKQYCKQNQTILCTILNNISTKCINSKFFVCFFATIVTICQYACFFVHKWLVLFILCS
jgi:hypothetical protein